LLWGAATAVATPIVVAAMRYLTPRPAPRREVVGKRDELPSVGNQMSNNWKIARVGNVDVAVALDAKGEVVAYELRCTHANCSLHWEPDDDSFHCPCHGGRFGANGEPIEGPPSRPMKRLKTERDGADVVVVVGG